MFRATVAAFGVKTDKPLAPFHIKRPWDKEPDRKSWIREWAQLATRG